MRVALPCQPAQFIESPGVLCAIQQENPGAAFAERGDFDARVENLLVRAPPQTHSDSLIEKWGGRILRF